MKQAVLEFLDRIHLVYECMEHQPVMTMEEGKSIAGQLGVTSCKSLFLRNRQGNYFLLLLPENKGLVAKNIAGQIGSSHLSFCTPEEMQTLLHATSGAVSVLGLMFDSENRIQLLVDKNLMASDYIGCHPCVNTCSLKIRLQDVTILFSALTRIVT